MNHRPLRVGQLIRDELAKLLEREVEFDGALVTITEVDVSKKIDIATVYVSVLPDKAGAYVLEILGKARNNLQYGLLRKLNIKPMPRIEFALDRGPENAARIEKNLSENE